MAVTLLFLLVVGLLMIGVPIAISLGLSSIIFLMVYSDGSLSSVAQTLFSAFHGHYTLLGSQLAASELLLPALAAAESQDR